MNESVEEIGVEVDRVENCEGVRGEEAYMGVSVEWDTGWRSGELLEASTLGAGVGRRPRGLQVIKWVSGYFQAV